MSMPTISIIIPCTRSKQVKNALERLVWQTYPARLIEILLIGSECAALADLYPVRVIEIPSLCYPGKMRNRGARAAIGDYLLFLDDDCEPALDWVEQNIRALEQPGIGAVGGQVMGKSRQFFARCIDFARFGFSQAKKERETWVCSASLGVKRQAFIAARGFNEDLRSEEDIDFCFRLWNLEYKTLYQPAIKVLHDHRRATFPTLMRYSYFYGRESGLYVKRLYAQASWRNKILTAIQHPWLYPLMILPVSLGATLNLVRINMWEYPVVLLYAPFILLSKLASHVGIWLWLWHERGK
ncbi:MAG: glycosyltransferase [Chloroflexota bacterium]|nr:glycosyltransferase [Chloroflexota bacterium]